MLRWSDFCFRLGILRNLVLRYFCPWDEHFFHPIVVDIWYLACNIDAVVDLANLSDQESLFLDEDELELVVRLSLVHGQRQPHNQKV